jgi:hypothetical protein
MDNTAMNISYEYNAQYNCIEIKYSQENIYLIDIPDFCKILNSSKKFVIRNPDKYPSYISNSKRYTFIDFIYIFPPETTTYIFENKNEFDLRNCNVKIYHNYHNIIKEQYKVINYIQGHYNNFGIDAFIMKNPIWVVKENEKEKLLMYCEPNIICKLCNLSYQKILDFEKEHNEKITWFKCENGYIAGKTKLKQLYIHQVITDYFDNGRGTSNISVDHIDRDPLNNTVENLRLATREEQEQNSRGIMPNTKRKRQSNARPLPDGITQDMLKKYVVYYYNYIDKKRDKAREYFRVEGHPKLEKSWETTKSNKVSILEKLNQANKVIEELENDIYPTNYTEQRGIPKYVSLIEMHGSPHLTFDKKTNEGKRMNLKMILPDNYNLDIELINLQNKICQKYNIPEFIL